MTILIINGKKVSPKKGKVNKVEVKQGDSVELLDANGQPANIQAEVSGEDLIIYDENGQVEWVIAQYQNAPQLAAMIPPASNPATEAVLASEMGNKFSTGITAVGGLLLMGGAIALSSNNDDEDDKPVSIQENVKAAPITNVKPDELDGNKISYTISDDRFEVDKDGNLKLKPGLALDYETEESLSVEVTAKDENGKEVTKTVKIKVEDDKSDNPNREPDLELGQDEVSVKENIQGEKITSVKFTDPDGDLPIYEVSDNRFEVVSGNLKLKDGVALDYEKEKTISVKVTAKDGRGLQDSETVKITVLDDKSDNPNHPPALTLNTTAVTVKENAKGANIAKVTGKDDDGDKLTYTVSDSRFEVDSKGNLKLKAGESLDYEKEKNLTLKVTASDGKSSVSKDVKITVTNDTADDAVTPQPNNPPVLTLDKTEVSIKENIQGATITGVKATDKDGDKISYTVSDNRFEVDSKGNLKLKSGQSLDYEKEKNITLKVTASDGKSSVSKDVKITVTNDTADDAVTPQPNNPPVLTLDKTEVSIKENIQGATITGVKATDKDGDKISYSVNDNRFEIDSKGNLKLKSGQFLDYEKEKNLTLKVTASDGKNSVSKDVKITVTNDTADDAVTPRPNNAPVLTLDKTEVSIKENTKGATITSVKATDKDGDKISYTVSDTRFEIDDKGNLKLKSGVALDFEKEKNLTLKVTASDGKSSVSKEVKITVEDDQADNPPDLTTNLSTVSVKENIKGAYLVNIKETGFDNDQLTYTVSDNRFEIDDKGNLKLKGSRYLDYEKEPNLTVTVTASDGKNTASKDIKIIVEDDPWENNHAPKLELFNTVRYVKENIQGAELDSLKFTDPDGDYPIFTVSDNRFEVVPSKQKLDDGLAYTIKLKDGLAFDYEAEKRVEFTVIAEDGHGGYAYKNVYYLVENDTESDYTNEKPDLELGKNHVLVKENAKGEKITTVKFTDPDGDSPIYEISDDRFEIVSGTLKLKDGIALDYQKDKTVIIEVAAKDGRGLQDTETVKITVKPTIEEIGKDIVFIIDASGSMYDNIETVKANVHNLIGKLFANNLNTNIGIMTYSNDDLLWVTKTADTPQKAYSAINAVFEQGGSTELVSGSLKKALNEFTWRPGEEMTKQIWLFGDEPGDDLKELEDVYALSHATKVALDGEKEYAEYIPVNAIALEGSDTAKVFKEITDRTQGTYFEGWNDLDTALNDIANLGTNRNDIIHGTDADNIINGGAGNDTLHGGLGSDTYIEGPGAGKDTIIETNPNGKDTNRIDFTGSSFYDTTFARNGDDLIVTGKDNSVTVTGFYDHTDGHKVDDFVFDDTAIDYAMAVLYADVQQGKTITYTNVDEHVKNATLNGKQLFIVAEDDAVVKTSDTQDVVVVNGDNVEVDTGANSDKIYINGSGKIEGGAGSDEYFICKNFGDVTIYDQSGDSDQLHFSSHSLNDLFISWEDTDLVLKSLTNPYDRVAIKQQSEDSHRIESIDFKDGSELTFKELESAAKIYQNYSYADVATDASIMESIMQQMHDQHLI